MSEGLIIPAWYRIASRGLALATIVGLVASIGGDLYHVPMPFAVGMGFAFMALFGGPAFILLRWIGVNRGYVSGRDGRIYGVILLAVTLTVAVLIVTRA